MNGTVPGTMILTNTFSSDAPKLRATLRNLASLVLTPDWVLMRIGITAPRKTTATFDQMPIPNQMMMSGNNVMRGTALSVSTKGPKKYCNRFDQPMASPRGMAMAAAPT